MEGLRREIKTVQSETRRFIDDSRSSRNVCFNWNDIGSIKNFINTNIKTLDIHTHSFAINRNFVSEEEWIKEYNKSYVLQELLANSDFINKEQYMLVWSEITGIRWWGEDYNE